MLRFFVLLLLSTTLAYSQVGEILSLHNAEDAYLVRSGTKMALAQGTLLEVGDNLHSENSHVLLILYPKIQMSIVKGTEFTITKHVVDEAESGDRTVSLLELIKGLVRIQVIHDANDSIDQKVDAKGVTFGVRGTEYEVSSSDDDAELDVVDGEVEVTSPYVKTFVPEIVKPNQGFRFDRKARKFARRAMKERNREARFLHKDEVRERWKTRKAERMSKRLERRQVRESVKQERLQEKAARREARRERKKGKGR